MGLFEKIFPKAAVNAAINGYFKTLTAYSPVFTSWSGKLYESDIVRTAIHARATHISKLRVQIVGSAQPVLQTRLRQQPNSFQTWSQFLYRLSTILDMQNTAFLVPISDDYGRTVGIYSVMPSSCEVVAHAGEAWLRYQFASGEKAAVELARCGILTKYQYQDDFFGEKNTALSPTMELIDIQNQGIQEAVKSSASYRFYARMTNFVKPEDLVKERKRFTEKNFRDEGGGMLLFPNTYDQITQIQSKPFVVDAEQMKLINQNVFNYFGVNEDIVQNKAVGDKWSAFYEGAVEPFAIQLSEVLTVMLFTATERSNGAEVMATANRLQYMSNKEKLEVSAQMADRGIMNRDEIREIWNLPPLPNDEGQAYTIRGEYYLLGKGGKTGKEGEGND